MRFKTHLFLFLLTAACSKVAYKTAGDENQSLDKTESGLPMIAVGPASPTECTAGGYVYQVYRDSNGNGLFDDSETLMSRQTLCHGTNGVDGINGQNGIDGQNGVDGQDGADGQNGADGRDGTDATVSLFTPIEILTPCGNTVPYKEILLRLKNGQVMAVVSNNTQGDMTRLALVTDGTFMSTDGSNCIFTLSTSADGLTRSLSWNNQVQNQWPLL